MLAGRSLVLGVVLAWAMGLSSAYAKPSFALDRYASGQGIDLQAEGGGPAAKGPRIPLSLITGALFQARFPAVDRGTKQAMHAYNALRTEVRAAAPSLTLRFREHALRAADDAERHGSHTGGPSPRARFIVSLLGASDPLLRATSLAYLANPARVALVSDPVDRAVSRLLSSKKSRSILVSDRDLSDADLAHLAQVPELAQFTLRRFPGYLVLGMGPSQWALENVVEEIQSVSDPAVRRKLDRRLREAAARGLLHVHDFAVGAAGQFDPISSQLVFSMLSRASARVWLHELEHFRFERLTRTLARWMKRKGYAMPFELDGPGAEGGGEFGGLYTLVNELNSWRHEAIFDPPGSTTPRALDEQILAKFRTLYADSVGPSTLGVMQQLWTPDLLGNPSVPRLLRSRILALNRIPSTELAERLAAAQHHGRRVEVINLLRLVAARGLAGSDGPLQERLLDLASANRDAEVRGLLRGLLERAHAHALGEAEPQASAEAKASSLRGLLDRVLEASASSGVWDPQRRRFVLRAAHPQPHAALDRDLVGQLFDGRTPTQKRALIAEVLARFLPEELPHTFARARELLGADHADANDHLTARYFLMAEPRAETCTATWGLALHHALVGRELGPKTHEALLVFYEHTLPQMWRGAGERLDSTLELNQLADDHRGLVTEVARELSVRMERTPLEAMAASGALLQEPLYLASLPRPLSPALQRVADFVTRNAAGMRPRAAR